MVGENFGQTKQTLCWLVAVPAAQERGGFWGRTHRLGLVSAIVADALSGHCWPTDASRAGWALHSNAVQRLRQALTCAMTCVLDWLLMSSLG